MSTVRLKSLCTLSSFKTLRGERTRNLIFSHADQQFFTTGAEWLFTAFRSVSEARPLSPKFTIGFRVQTCLLFAGSRASAIIAASIPRLSIASADPVPRMQYRTGSPLKAEALIYLKGNVGDCTLTLAPTQEVPRKKGSTCSRGNMGRGEIYAEFECPNSFGKKGTYSI